MNVSRSMYLPFSNWSLKPLLGESARGYFLRLVANEGHYSASVYGNEVGINGRRLTPEETLDTLLTLPISDEHKAALRLYSPLADGAYYNLGGQRLRQRQMVFSTRRFCRACLADSQHHRVWWDICAFSTCPDHGTPIEDVDASGQPIGWWWADVGSDTSGNPLARWAPSQAGRHDRTLEAFILERLGVLPQTPWPLLDGYHLYEVIEACEYLGMWLGNERTFTVPTDQLERLAVGMSALSGPWEDLVFAMRGWFTEHVPSDVLREGKMKSMAWAWNAWPKLPGTTIGDVLKRATTEAFEPIGKMGKKRFRETRDFYAERALSTLAQNLDVKTDALIPLARHVNVIGDITEPWELTSDQEVALRAAIADLVPVSEVSCILGVESWSWKSLVEAGVLKAFGSFSSSWMFLRSDAEGLITKALLAATEASEPSVSLRTYSRRHGLSMGDVLMKVLDGSLMAARDPQNQPGIRSIRIMERNRRQVSDWHLPESEGIDIMSSGEAAVVLHLEHSTVKRLVEIGEIKAAGPRGCLSRESVTAFGLRYANAQLYRPALGCRADEVVTSLRKLGVGTRFGFREPNALVGRIETREVLALNVDPDDPSVARFPLWDEFRRKVCARCPLFLMPVAVPEIGATIRTSNRRVAVHASVDRVDGWIMLAMDLHEIVTPRRWRSFMRNREAIKDALDFMSWNACDDGRGWRLTSRLRTTEEVEGVVEALAAMHRYFA